MKLLDLIILILFSICSSAQITKSLFKDGVYLENLNVTIPWNSSPKDLKKYGTPKLEKEGKQIALAWDSVIILNGVLTKLFFIPVTGRNHNFLYVKGIVDSINAEKFACTITNNFGLPYKIHLRNKGRYKDYRWLIKNHFYIGLYTPDKSANTYNFLIPNTKPIENIR